MRPISDSLLYGILDTGYCAPDAMPGMALKLLEGGVGIIQLRAKNLTADRVEELGKILHPLTAAAGVPLVVNDFPEAAAACGAEGVHVGVDDMTVDEARRRAGGRCFVGKSSHSVAQALEGAAQGADYLGFGPLFATATKPDYTPIGTAEIQEVHRSISVPVFCIGGIKKENLPGVIAAGARRVVIVSGLLQAEHPSLYAKHCLSLLRGEPIPAE